VTFLKKLGSILAQGIAVATGVWPLVSGLFGSSTKAQQTGTTVINDLTSIGQVVVQTEALIQTPGSGATKLQAAAPLVANIVKTSELVSGHQIANEALFIQGCTDLTNAVAEILNSLSANNLKTGGSPTPSVPAPTSVPSAPVPPTGA
jgi:hypothetical protein